VPASLKVPSDMVSKKGAVLSAHPDLRRRRDVAAARGSACLWRRAELVFARPFSRLVLENGWL